MVKVKYRYVGFGTVFVPARGARCDSAQIPSRLYQNELVVDTAGRCWGYDGEELSILDHHFYRERGQFPSAAAAVLHNAGRIAERFSALDGDLWLVTHRDPDFDAFCATYLARGIISGQIAHNGWEEFGLRPDGWFRERDEINWFKPALRQLPAERRWPALLAAYASCVDNCIKIACPKSRALHSVLYAGIARGRNYEATGAVDFFDAARNALQDEKRALNPLFDPVLDDNPIFAPEFALLDNEIELYRRDMARSRRALVYLLESRVGFDQWFSQVRATPLLAANLATDPIHLCPPHNENAQADGVYLREPECLLFKEWARTDTENSSMGQGFLFTAVAYPGERRGEALNETSYFFSLDPERAENKHLYNVWARLQSAEVRALIKCPPAARKLCRVGYEDRAGEYQPLFDDPWFDGSNYCCTIIATPNRGSAIGHAGSVGDLSDDPVAQIVQEELEFSIFSTGITLRDFATKDNTDLREDYDVGLAAQRFSAAEEGYYRFGRIELRHDVKILQGDMAQQIGRVLWQFFGSEIGLGEPIDFVERHLLRNPDWVGVWSRRGVVVACKSGAGAKRTDIFESIFGELAKLSREIGSLSQLKPTEATNDEIIAQGEELMRRVAAVKYDLALPDNRLLSRFFEASRQDEVLAMLRNINSAAAERSQRAKATRLSEQQAQFTEQMATNIDMVAKVQRAVEWVECFLVSVYFAHLWHMFAHDTMVEHFFKHHLAPYGEWIVPAGVVVAAAVGLLGSLMVLKPWKHEHRR